MQALAVSTPSELVRKETQLTKFPLGFPVSVHHRFEMRNQIIDVKDASSHNDSSLINLSLLPETSVTQMQFRSDRYYLRPFLLLTF
jgi:hypothetical protein